MKICFCSREFPPETHIGGIGTYTYNMASALAELGHTVHVITSTNNSDRTIEYNDVRVHRIRRREFRIKELSLLSYSYSVANKISQIDCQFDILHASEFESEAFWFALEKKIPLVTRLATPFFLIEKLNGKVFIGPRPFFNWMEKKQTLKSDGIFTSTKALAKTVSEEWGLDLTNVEIIPNSVDVAKIIQFGSNRLVPGILKKNEFILYFGRLEKRKGVHVLARALPAAFKQFPNIDAVFIGSDLGYQGYSMREYIKKQSGKYNRRLVFFENLPQEKLFPIVNSAKIVILPSLWEAFGFVCVEAMALGRPVVATSGSGFEEIIEDNISGYLVKPGNSELLSEKIISCLKDEQSLCRISEGARKRACDFDVSNVVVKLLAYYEKVIREWTDKRRK